jgi:hypothetical protein
MSLKLILGQLGHDAFYGDAGLRSGLAGQLVYAGLNLDIF